MSDNDQLGSETRRPVHLSEIYPQDWADTDRQAIIEHTVTDQ